MTVDDPVHRGNVPPPVDLAGHLREFGRALLPALVVALVVGGLVFGLRTLLAPKEYAATLVTQITTTQELVPGDAFVEQLRAPFMALAQDANVLNQVLSEVDTDWNAEEFGEHIELSKGPAPQILVFQVRAWSQDIAEQLARSLVTTVAQASFANHSRDVARQVDQVQAAITAEQARNATLAPDDPGKAESDGELQALRAQLTTLQSSGGDQLSVLAAPDEDPSPVSPKPVSEALVAALVTLLVVAELIVLLRGRLGKRPNRTWARRISRKHGAHFDASATAPGEFDPLTSAKLVQALRDGRPALLLIGEQAAAPPSLSAARDPDRGRFRTLVEAPLSSHWWQRVNAGAASLAVVVVSTAGTDRAAAERSLRQLADLGVHRTLVLQRGNRRPRRRGGTAPTTAADAPATAETEGLEPNGGGRHGR